jgi:hypothetical protein
VQNIDQYVDTPEDGDVTGDGTVDVEDLSEVIDFIDQP